jgi:hypothetical protein
MDTCNLLILPHACWVVLCRLVQNRNLANYFLLDVVIEISMPTHCYS